jgi:hypothetical protein
MGHQFARHYTREEARALLPKLREWLAQLEALHASLRKHDRRVETMLDAGTDRGGQTVNDWVRTMADIQRVLEEFRQRDIVVEDLERGRLNFPAIVGGREVFLSWQKGEPDIEYWRDLDAGAGGRTPI